MGVQGQVLGGRRSGGRGGAGYILVNNFDGGLLFGTVGRLLIDIIPDGTELVLHLRGGIQGTRSDANSIIPTVGR